MMVAGTDHTADNVRRFLDLVAQASRESGFIPAVIVMVKTGPDANTPEIQVCTDEFFAQADWMPLWLLKEAARTVRRCNAEGRAYVWHPKQK